MDSKKFTVISIIIFILSLLVFVSTLVLVVFKPVNTGNGITTSVQKVVKKEKTQNIDVGDVSTQVGKTGKFYKAYVVLEVKGKKTPKKVEDKMPQIKDKIISSIAYSNSSDLTEEEGMKKLKEKIRVEINSIIESTSEDVVDVLFTQSILQ